MTRLQRLFLLFADMHSIPNETLLLRVLPSLTIYGKLWRFFSYFHLFFSYSGVWCGVTSHPPVSLDQYRHDRIPCHLDSNSIGTFQFVMSHWRNRGKSLAKGIVLRPVAVATFVVWRDFASVPVLPLRLRSFHRWNDSLLGRGRSHNCPVGIRIANTSRHQGGVEGWCKFRTCVLIHSSIVSTRSWSLGGQYDRIGVMDNPHQQSFQKNQRFLHPFRQSNKVIFLQNIILNHLNCLLLCCKSDRISSTWFDLLLFLLMMLLLLLMMMMMMMMMMMFRQWWRWETTDIIQLKRLGLFEKGDHDIQRRRPLLTGYLSKKEVRYCSLWWMT